MTTEAGKKLARHSVETAASVAGMNRSALAEAAGIDYGTLGDFLNGRRWPKGVTFGKIENALGWAAGTITGIADGLTEAPHGSVGGGVQDRDTLLYRRPEGLTDEEWETVKVEAEDYIQWQVSRAARER